MMDMVKDMMIGSTGPRGGRKPGLVESAAQSAVKSIGSAVGREIIRGVLGSLLGGASALKVLNWILASIVLLAVAGVLGWRQFGLLRGVPPKDLGVHRRPSQAAVEGTPNSVSSQADLWPDHPQQQAARIAPLALQGDGPATIARLRSVVRPCRAPPS
jgi:hypothetical protein